MKSKALHEVFSYPVERSRLEPDFLNDYLRYFDKLMPVVRFARLFSPLVKACFTGKDKRFAFYTSKHNQLMEGIDSRSLLLFGKPQEIPFALSSGISFYPVYDIIPDLFALFRSDPLLESVQAARLIDSVTTIIAQMNPEYLVVWNDSLFLERFLIFCGRRVGVKSICIQHGIFHDTFDCRFLDGYYADYMFVWGKSQAELYIDSSFDKNKLRIMGYPFSVGEFNACKNNNVICLLGSNAEASSVDLGLRKRQVYEEIADLLSSNNYQVVYKPHPFEKDKIYLPDNVKIISISLNEAFNVYSTFIGLTSTALMEATLQGKIAIQYYEDCFGGSDFSQKGFSYTARNPDEILSLLSSIKVPSVIATDALLVSQNPVQRFLDTVDGLTDSIDLPP